MGYKSPTKGDPRHAYVAQLNLSDREPVLAIAFDLVLIELSSGAPLFCVDIYPLVYCMTGS